MTGDREALVRAHRQGAVIHPPTRLEPDVLSGLPARSALQTRLSEPLPAGRGRGVAVLEIDALGMISEVYGPDTGSAVLRELARRLDAVTGEAHLGRWRPDVFVWVQDAADAEAVIGELSRAVVAHLREPFEANGHRLRLAARMGLAVSPRTPVADLLAAATSALRSAKRPDRDDVVWYSETMGLEHPGVTQLSAALGRGIANDELRLHYQPVMDLTEDRVAGVEALVRWERPGAGLLGPGSFIDVAERTGQIVALGAWVAHHACAAAVHLNALGLPPLGVSINVSARQLADPGLIGMLAQVLHDTGCPPSVLTIEITETALMVDLEDAVVTLAAIKDLGIGLDLDDFGTGYSSLLYLKHFPVDRIKIDQSFVAGLGTDHADTTIVASTIALAHAVGIRAVAEGVETLAQLAVLQQMGCDFIQGYLFSRPLGAEALADWLTTGDARAQVLADRAPAQSAAAGHLAADVPSAGRGSPNPGERRRRTADQRDAVANRRDATANHRDEVADARDDTADQRDAVANRRDAVADAREDQQGF